MQHLLEYYIDYAMDKRFASSAHILTIAYCINKGAGLNLAVAVWFDAFIWIPYSKTNFTKNNCISLDLLIHYQKPKMYLEKNITRIIKNILSHRLHQPITKY